MSYRQCKNGNCQNQYKRDDLPLIGFFIGKQNTHNIETTISGIVHATVSSDNVFEFHNICNNIEIDKTLGTGSFTYFDYIF